MLIISRACPCVGMKTLMKLLEVVVLKGLHSIFWVFHMMSLGILMALSCIYDHHECMKRCGI